MQIFPSLGMDHYNSHGFTPSSSKAKIPSSGVYLSSLCLIYKLSIVCIGDVPGLLLITKTILIFVSTLFLLDLAHIAPVFKTAIQKDY